MKKSLLIITLVLVGFASLVQAQSRAVLESTYSPPYVKAYQKDSAWVGEKGKVRWDMVTYSVDRFGGTGNASDNVDLGIDIPDNAIVIDGLIDVMTAQLPATNKLAITINSTADFFAASTNLSVVGIKATTPTGAAANAFKTTADRNVYLNIPGTITQGVFKVWIKSYLSQ